MSHSQVQENIANWSDEQSICRGGGVCLESSIGVLKNCLIAGNDADNPAHLVGKGGGLYINGAHVQLENCTIAGNRARPAFGAPWHLAVWNRENCVAADEIPELTALTVEIRASDVMTELPLPLKITRTGRLAQTRPPGANCSSAADPCRPPKGNHAYQSRFVSSRNRECPPLWQRHARAYSLGMAPA